MARVVMKQITGSVYIGRAGRGEDGYFGNPYRVGEICARCWQRHDEGGATLACYEAYLNERASTDLVFRTRVEALGDKFLWCPGGCKKKRAPCHGDVLAEYADGRRKWRFL